jgi:TorA maturation chaperone TorD
VTSTTTIVLTTTTSTAERLVARGEEFARLARLLGEDTGPLAEHLAEHLGSPSAEELARRWVRWFDLGRVPPYEGSNVPPSAGGVTPRLADIAGFYRAFGVTVPGNRPDHIVAELEFMALVLRAEAEAVSAGDTGRAAIAADAARAFLRDHLGTWIDAWAARVAEVEDLAPWADAAAAAAALVRAEAADRNVIPLRPAAVLPADAGIADDAEAGLECGEESW